MKSEFLNPAALIATELLRRNNPLDGELSEEAIASSFKRAYRGLLRAQKELQQESAKTSAEHYRGAID